MYCCEQMQHTSIVSRILHDAAAAVQNNSNKTELENFWEEDGVVALLPKWPLAEMLLPRTQSLALL